MVDATAGQSLASTATNTATQNQKPGTAPNKTSKTTVAVGATFDMAETRKFELDVSASTEVIAELVSVPAPAKLTELLAARYKQDGAVDEGG